MITKLYKHTPFNPSDFEHHPFWFLIENVCHISIAPKRSPDLNKTWRFYSAIGCSGEMVWNCLPVISWRGHPLLSSIMFSLTSPSSIIRRTHLFYEDLHRHDHDHSDEDHDHDLHHHDHDHRDEENHSRRWCFYSWETRGAHCTLCTSGEPANSVIIHQNHHLDHYAGNSLSQLITIISIYFDRKCYSSTKLVILGKPGFTFELYCF